MRVRSLLVKTLYTKPLSLTIGAINGVFASVIAAAYSGHILMYAASILLLIIAVSRIASVLYFSGRKTNRRSARRLELLYEIGAFSYSTVLGCIAATSLVLMLPTAVEVLLIAVALGYGTGAAARNAGRPAIAIGQLVFTLAPVAIGAIIVGGLPFYVLAWSIALMIPAIWSITMIIFNTLRESIGSAQTSAQLADRMQILARTDVVTGLANRAGLNHELVEHLMQLEPDSELAMFWLDLDKFKEVNDLLGHPVGDRVLAEIATRLKEQSPFGSTVARFGGDEFVIFCKVEGRKESEALGRKLLEDINRPIVIDRERLTIGCSIGIAVLPYDGEDADTLMQSADLALYHAKVNGRNQMCFFDPSMTRDLVRRREIEHELRAALTRDELSIFFQPIVDLETGRIRTFEALVRWFHPEKGELRPDEFIPVAEECGAIITLGNWITAQAAKAAAQWPDDITVAVNLSPVQIKAPGAAMGILAALREAKLDPSRLELEVTESLFLEDNDSTGDFINELSDAGVRFAMDDFGTGYSSLGYINKYPFKKIKVDRSFVSGDNVGVKSNAIIRAVAEMGSTLEMDIVAEGLETLEQVRAVREAGCTLGQGYYFSRAVPDYLAAMLLAQERDDDQPKIMAAR
ncbi:EAL domain-containing protein [Altererythrobacter sp. ZODW24]|uniref:putative bifunctional diguanylate cyclase/phosphodiesterase n=1 Tax=Altererythrobacter sp. ZODW24 TaxID=2185142 RepID=UPI000DF81D6E|nr:EAL domain-containing protein [Altererythrobacter sp. ZODW24]